MGPIKFKLFKGLPKNKRFNYTPRYYKGKQDTDETAYPTKFDAYAETLNDNDISGHWHEKRISSRNRNNSGFNTTIYIIILILVFISLYILDFDLSIFSKS
ncbi:MAG: hypothetical protein ED556_09775 [Winogradskyella sp.]|uniref:hypothetical protein n=1 Tax=Winogradskyella sp. TaxID=1883156 RepID=UPI000F406E8B|nr:hypothetical protein [Winogradskyella sp.]RNC84863.1 MAG: hypothetical protein ED556_09775 [Winogradskyella sp.]